MISPKVRVNRGFEYFRNQLQIAYETILVDPVAVYNI